MIVRDEEAFLPDCLESIRDVVDEIVIVDTGSRDATKAVADRFGARIFDFPWNDDFATPRNHALDQATGDWILYIDADERLRPVDPAYLHTMLSDPRKIGYQVQFFPAAGFTGYWEYRLFRNDPRIRFKGTIHEGTVHAMREIAAAEDMAIGHLDAALDHVGYEGDQQHKHERNLPLLRAGLAQDPDRVFSWSHLGRVLTALGDEDGAIAAWRSGVDLVRRQSGHKPEFMLPYLDLIPCLHDRGENVGPLLDEARARFPANMMLVWLAARVAMDGGEYETAAGLLERLAGIDGDTYFDGEIAHDRRIFGVLAYESLGTCCFRLGRFADAALWYGRAEAAEPEEPGHRLRRLVAESGCRR
jgi:tetratricopeptide (TPR) repeat protein